MSATAEHITSKDAKVHTPETQNKPDAAESIEEALALCRWEDDGGAVPGGGARGGAPTEHRIVMERVICRWQL